MVPEGDVPGLSRPCIASGRRQVGAIRVPGAGSLMCERLPARELSIELCLDFSKEFAIEFARGTLGHERDRFATFLVGRRGRQVKYYGGASVRILY